MALTPLAEGLVDSVRDFLMQAEAILHKSPAFNPATATRRFRMLMSDYVETVVMTEAIPRIQKLAPGITFEMFSSIDSGIEAVERGEIDLAITPSRYISPQHPSESLFEDEFVCLVWSQNTQVRDLSLETYLGLGHVVVRFGRQRQIPTFDEWFLERFEHQRRIEVVTTTFNLVPQLLIGTSRIATIHRRLATFYAQYLPLKILAPPIEIPKLEECMQWHRSRDRDPGTIWVRTILRSVCHGEPYGPKNTIDRVSGVRANKSIGLPSSAATRVRRSPRPIET
jgi:LysR family nod box-dependent transcriptional activator